MKTIKEVLGFCIVFTFYNQYKIERVGELNHVRDCNINVLSKCDFIREDNVIRVLSFMEDISLLVLERNIENLVQEIDNESWFFTILLSRRAI